jgi:putative transposase
MRKSRFTESQIATILGQAGSGLSVKDICTQYGISAPTYYKWRARYGGMSAVEIQRLRQLEEENAKLKRMFTDLALEHRELRESMSRKP